MLYSNPFKNGKVLFESEPTGEGFARKDTLGKGGFSPRTKEAPKTDENIDTRVGNLTGIIRQKGVEVNPFVAKYFSNPELYNALPSQIKDSDQSLMDYIENTSKFSDLIGSERDKRATGDTSGLLGETVQAADSTHANGEGRRDEKGEKINVDYLRTVGVDPSRVLFFRATQPMDQGPKPEYYWTSDLVEATKGLAVEVTASQRETAVVLVSDLQSIDQNGGLIQDVNDDSGISVRQINEGPFDQNKAIAKVPAKP